VAIGCGFGGPYNSKEERVLESIQITGWSNFPLREWLQEHLKTPAFVANDSNAAAWGEYQKGAGKGSRHFFYTNLGSGVGGGFVFNGRLFDGQGYGAGEFGHTFVPDWTSEIPGSGIEIEKLCSGWAIEGRLNTPGYLPATSRLEQMRTESGRKLTPRQLGKAARLGDAFALEEIDRIADSMGCGLANMLSLTGVEKIAIGGGVSNLGEILIEPIRRQTQKYAFVSSQGHYTISRCELGDSVVLVGAILLAKMAFKLS
jgi:glucokinase